VLEDWHGGVCEGLRRMVCVRSLFYCLLINHVLMTASCEGTRLFCFYGGSLRGRCGFRHHLLYWYAEFD
jgi:hypothetical protein